MKARRCDGCGIVYWGCETRRGRSCRGGGKIYCTIRTAHKNVRVVVLLLDPGALLRSPPRALLRAYESILSELRRRGGTRTNDAPVGQYAEWIASKVLGGRLEPNSSKGVDLVTRNKHRVQVKARVLRGEKGRGERQLSVFRSFEFDYCLVPLFDTTYRVSSATQLPVAIRREHAVRHKHVRGYILIANHETLQLGWDVTKWFQLAGRRRHS